VHHCRVSTALRCNTRNETVSDAVLKIRYCRLVVHRRLANRDYPRPTPTVIYAPEHYQAQGRDKIDWKLLTGLPVRPCLEAIEKLDWCARLLRHGNIGSKPPVTP